MDTKVGGAASTRADGGGMALTAARLAVSGVVAAIALGCAIAPPPSSVPWPAGGTASVSATSQQRSAEAESDGVDLDLDGQAQTSTSIEAPAEARAPSYQVQAAACGWAAPWDALDVKASKQACWAQVHLQAVNDQERIAWDLVRANPSSKFVIGFPISKVRGVATAVRKADSEAKAADKNSRNAAGYASQARAAAGRERNAAKKPRLQNIADEASYYASTASSAASAALAKARALKTATIR